MGIQAPAEVKYGLIYEAIKQDDNVLNISALCKIAGVSRSGFYACVMSAHYLTMKKQDRLFIAPMKKIPVKLQSVSSLMLSQAANSMPEMWSARQR